MRERVFQFCVFPKRPAHRHTKGSHSFIGPQISARGREQDRHNTHPRDAYILAKETDIKQTPTLPTQARSGHRRRSANVHGQIPQASHQTMLPPGWGGAGQGPASSGQRGGEEHWRPYTALGRGDTSSPSLRSLARPEGSRGTTRSAQLADASHGAAAPRVRTPPASRPLSHP